MSSRTAVPLVMDNSKVLLIRSLYNNKSTLVRLLSFYLELSSDTVLIAASERELNHKNIL